MKKRLFTSKIIIPAIILCMVMLTGMVVGFSGVFAEPSVQEIVGEQEFGSFKPSHLLGTDDELVPVAWLSTRIIGVQSDLWKQGKEEKESGAEDKQDILNNIYQHDNIEDKMFIGEITDAIIQPLNDDANYYVVYCNKLKQINATQAYMYVGPNAEDGEVLSADQYYYDAETSYLYIEKSVLEDRIKDGSLVSLRAEAGFVFEDINTVSKSVDIVTKIADDAGANDYQKNSVANRTEKFNIRQSQVGDISFCLVNSDALAYFSRENITVYFDGAKFDSWIYNENTGYMTLSANIFDLNDLYIEIKAINDVSPTQIKVQTEQSDDELAPHAAGLTDVVRDYNEYIDYIQYDEEQPKVGAYQQMDYVARVLLGVDGSGRSIEPSIVAVAGTDRTYFPREVLNLLTERAKDNGYVNGFLRSATWSVQPMVVDRVSGVTRPNNVPAVPSDMSKTSADVYGEIAYYLFKAKQAGSESEINKYIGYVNSLSNAYLFNFSGSNIPLDYRNDGLSKQWPTSRMIDNRWHTHCGTEQSRYVCGLKRETSTFLGGIVHGRVLIDGDCANIRGSASWAQEVNNVFGHKGDSTDYQCGTSVIYVSDVDENGYGDMYTCMWSRSLQSSKSGAHAQKIQSYSKIKYKYSGEGTLRFEKVNEYGRKIGGAEYNLYKEDGTFVQKIVTNESAAIELKLRKGKYYIEESNPPTGYLKDKDRHSFEIKIDEVCDVEVKDEFQLCRVEFTVFDKTTKGNSVEVGIPGIQFRLVDGSGTPVAFRDANGNDIKADSLTSSADGKITFWVRTLDVTPGVQIVGKPNELYLCQVNTVNNYRKTTESWDEDFCDKIRISGNTTEEGVCPDRSGRNTYTTKRHYENRQWVTIKSHVQDSSLLGDTTQSVFGGYTHNDGSTEVKLTNAVYNIMTTSEKTLLGYTDNGSPIYLKPNVIIGYAKDGAASETKHNPTVLTSYSSGPNDKAYIEISSSVNSTYVGQTNGLSVDPFSIVIGDEANEKSFDEFKWSDRDNDYGGMRYRILQGNFEVPNGEYALILSEPSSGYCRYENKQDDPTFKNGWDGTGIDQKNITTVDARWVDNPNSYVKPIMYIDNVPVIEQRQTVSLNIFVKGYYAKDKTVSSKKDGSLVRNDYYDMKNGITKSDTEIINGNYYDERYAILRELSVVDQNTKKETRTKSDTGKITTSSTEYVSVSKKSGGAYSNVISVKSIPTSETNGKFNPENVVIELYNLTTIVDVKTGTVIPALNKRNGDDTIKPIGRYKADENGYVLVDKMGSDALSNPYPDETNNKTFISAAMAFNEDGEAMYNELPNGVYFLRVYQQDAQSEFEYGLTENIVFDTSWKASSYVKQNIQEDSLHLIQVEPDKPGVYELNLAPDLPVSTTSSLRYDPHNVVESKDRIYIGNERNISTILGCRKSDTNYSDALAWINKHMNDFSYRISEMINNDGSDNIQDDQNRNSEIMDNLPTTFAMYVSRDIIPQSNATFKYYTYYYYQVTKTDYDNATAAEKKNKTYITDDGLHYKRFTSQEMLDDIVMNANSAGYVKYIDGGYEIDINKPVMGAVYNINWLNQRMAEASVNGTYNILVKLEVEKTTTNKLTGEQTIDRLNSGKTTLRIKNRNLFNID